MENAVAFGASGIGLSRTEHMFFEGDRIDAVREMILARNLEARQKAVAKLLPFQRQDFIGIFKALKGLPATIRLLDPPLHEFLPHDDARAARPGREARHATAEEITKRVHELHEFNPMLGHRGCRLGISFPEITEMQARAIFEAAAEVQKKGIKVTPEVMIPLVGFKKELDLQVEIVHRVAEEVQAEKKVKINYLVGTMIEVPRGAITADEIAKTAEFFSFGTNDLTQTTLGMSRDDSGLLPAALRGAGDREEQSVRHASTRAGVGVAHGDRGRARPQNAAGHQARHLRRARRRSRLGEVLPQAGLELRELLALPRAGGAPRGRPGGAGGLG